MKDMLVKSYRMHEVHSYIWSDIQRDKELGIETQDNIRIINAQTPDHAILRKTMIPTLLSFAKDNRSYSDSFGIFEIGHTVCGKRENGEADEQNKLGALFFSKTESEETLFLRARDAVTELCSDILHTSPEFVSEECEYDFEHPVNTFGVFVGGNRVGYLSVPHPTVCENVDKKCAIAFFEIFTALFADTAVAPLKYSEPSKFPAIEIDVTFVADIGAIVFGDVVRESKAAAGELLADVRLQDTYTAEGVSTVTLRFSFVSKDRTLTKQEITPLVEAISTSLLKLSMKAN
jgi:phenylalanyl-tRNA synthetase beta chain